MKSFIIAIGVSLVILTLLAIDPALLMILLLFGIVWAAVSITLGLRK